LATPTFLASGSQPSSPAAANLPRQRQIVLMRNDGGDGRLRANNADAMLAAVEAGLGVAVAPDFIVGTGLATGRLVTILSG